MRITVIAVGCLMAFAMEATAQRAAPTDNELHSAYCMGLLRAEIDELQRMLEADARAQSAPAHEPELSDLGSLGVEPNPQKRIAQERQSIARLRAAHSRLAAYMAPKLAAMTLDSMPLAIAMQRGTADWKAFLAGGADAAWVARARACEDPTWLPF